ncbi:MAG: hypothetical protein IJS90_01435 [Clostridia bacterium]|nr:hypothetical protein [Clostridia bacterium]
MKLPEKPEKLFVKSPNVQPGEPASYGSGIIVKDCSHKVRGDGANRPPRVDI